jgi:hypothetical protein
MEARKKRLSAKQPNLVRIMLRAAKNEIRKK